MLDGDPRDPWGRLPTDPNYGIPPEDTTGAPTPTPAPTPAPTPTPTPTPDPKKTPPQYNLPGYTGPWAPDLSWWQDAPKFQFDAPAAFQAPTLADAQNEPGYAFARDEGLHALTNNRAAQGLARTGGTLKDLVTWGNKFADQNYSGVYNRKAGEYDRNFNNLFGIAKAQYEPQLTGWGQKMSMFGNAATNAFNRAWDAYKYAGDDAYRHYHDQLVLGAQ